MPDHDRIGKRRKFLYGAGALPVVLALRSWGAQGAERELTPACSDTEEPTPRQMEGPFFKPRSPQRTSLLVPQLRGTRIIVQGLVLSARCQPVAGALLDFWQCDDQGEYDNSGYRLRGHQYTDGVGAYLLETILPGVYPGRTRHIHVKVQAPGRPVLTTQLYFPEEPENLRDLLYRSDLLMSVMTDEEGKSVCRFDFVVKN